MHTPPFLDYFRLIPVAKIIHDNDKTVNPVPIISDDNDISVNPDAIIIIESIILCVE